MKAFTISVLSCTLAAGMASAQSLPHQKIGLWQQQSTMMGMHITGELCVDAATQEKLSAFSSSVAHHGKCERGPIVHGADGSWTNDSTCEFRPGAKQTVHAVVTGDFDSKYTMTLTSLPDGRAITTVTSTWMGACKPGQHGGDFVMGNGMKINVLDPTSSGSPGGAAH